MITDWHIYGIKGTPPPYATLYPLMGAIARGKFLDWWIFKYYKGAFRNQYSNYPASPNRYKQGGNPGMVVERIHYPEQPRTAKQQGNRSIFSDALYHWHYFTNQTKTYYNTIARPIGEYGIHRYTKLYINANYPMIIYWDTLEKNASDTSRLPNYFASSYFAQPLYPPAVNKLVSLGASGDLPIPGILKGSELNVPTIKPTGNIVLNQNSVNVLTAYSTGAIVNTLTLYQGKVGINTAVPWATLSIAGNVITDWNDRYFGTWYTDGTGYRLGIGTDIVNRHVVIHSYAADGSGAIVFKTGLVATPTEIVRMLVSGRVGFGLTAPTATIHIKAGVATASGAPLKFTTGTNLTNAELGAMEFTDPNFYLTITDSTVKRKPIVMTDGSLLTSGKIPIASTNGRLIDGQTPLAGTKVYYVSDSSGGTVNRKLTFINGILTSET